MRRIALVLLVVPACSGPSRGYIDRQPTDLGATTDGADSESSASRAWEDALDVVGPDVGDETRAEVFGHDADTLFRLDPTTFDVFEVGPFVGCDASMIDIALDRSSRMLGVSYGSLWDIDRMTGACTFIAAGSYPTSLSFVPEGTLGDHEALVGFIDDEYVEINVETGDLTTVGWLPLGLSSSGDLVSIEGGPTWLTVRGEGCRDQDCLIALNPATGAMEAAYGRIGYDEVYGLAAWGGRAYGFARGGAVFEVQVPGPVIIEVESNGPEWYGAGSSTLVPAQ